MNRSIDDLQQDTLAALLVAVGREGDVDAFETLFRHYSPRVKAYLSAKTRDRQLAEELMQETMMTVWKKAALFDPERGNAGAWVFTVARNLLISAHRKGTRPTFDPTDPAFVPEETMAADMGLVQRQDAERLHRAMKDLPPEQIELLHRSFFNEASHSAIAKDLDLPLGTVKSRIRIAFARLRAALEDRS